MEQDKGSVQDEDKNIGRDWMRMEAGHPAKGGCSTSSRIEANWQREWEWKSEGKVDLET